ncbi:MAG: hypothetical protein ACK52I_18230 [Pseudomonadota bacterium]|jgi:hypothetical protein
MKKYYISVLVEGNATEVMALKKLITNSAGLFDPLACFKSFSKSRDFILPKDLLFSDYDSFKADELILKDRPRRSFRSFWNQSVNGCIKGDRSNLFQLNFTFDSTSLFQSEWHAVSMKFPGLMIYLFFSEYDDIYEGRLVFKNGKIYRSTSQEYIKDRDGYSICLDENFQWFYVIPLDIKMQGIDPIYVGEDKIVPLVYQLSEVTEQVEFCNCFPIESFPSWLIEDEYYFELRPNTVFYPYPNKPEEPDAADFSM